MLFILNNLIFAQRSIFETPTDSKIENQSFYSLECIPSDIDSIKSSILENIYKQTRMISIREENYSKQKHFSDIFLVSIEIKYTSSQMIVSLVFVRQQAEKCTLVDDYLSVN